MWPKKLAVGPPGSHTSTVEKPRSNEHSRMEYILFELTRNDPTIYAYSLVPYETGYTKR